MRLSRDHIDEGMLRVIAGEFKGKRLKAVPGLDVRPTSDRLRETLFNILGQDMHGKSFLDICAGSGAVGIEALSRGARHVTFIEASRKSTDIIRENLETVAAGRKAELIARDAVVALDQLEKSARNFDSIFFDPPYSSPIYNDVMKLISKAGLLAEGGVLIVEHRAKSPLEPKYGDLTMYRELRQGDSALAFYSRE